jgi:hypothetical protein
LNSDWTKRTYKTDKYQGSWEDPSTASTQPARGYGTAGVAWEWMMDVCNRCGTNLWINIPHLTINPTDFPNGNNFNNEYVHKLAVLIRHGVDMRAVSLKNLVGGSANLNQLGTKDRAWYISNGGVAMCDPLAANLKVYVEYSNELWLRGQNTWLNNIAGPALGLGWDQAGAWCEVRAWRAFEDVFGTDKGRVINVAGPIVQTTAASVDPLFTAVYDNSSRNPWNTRPEVWKVPTYVSPGYQLGIGGQADYGTDPNLATDWPNAIASIKGQLATFKASMQSSHGIPLVSYEGGQAFDRYQLQLHQLRVLYPVVGGDGREL